MTSHLPRQNSRVSGAARTLVLAFVAMSVASAAVTYVLVTMFARKQEALHPFALVAEVSEISTDPAPWGQNWPHQYDGYRATAGPKFRGGSSAMPQSKLDAAPWLRRLYAGYAFSIDYREARGHGYMLYDQSVTERVTKRPQTGACLHCHGSVTAMYRQQGLLAMGESADAEALATSFNMPAVIRGFEEVSRKPYAEVLALLVATPDGHSAVGGAHPVSCIDCHDPKTMGLRVTRPGFVRGIAALAASEAAQEHLPSIGIWRAGDRAEPYDPNRDATGQEMRTFVCAQCHVEYYCGSSDVLEFPWGKGLRMEQLESHWDEKSFPDGKAFYDYKHGETGALVYKVQHPEFELWSQGIHARSGVSCADCHMPYERVGAKKLSNHNIQSPLETINNSCQTCHHVGEDNLRARVARIQESTVALTERAAAAMTDMLDAIREAQATGVDDAALSEVFDFQRKAMWRLDFISSENSQGFHADQESARILAESIDFSRKAEAAAIRLRTSGRPDTSTLPIQPVLGISVDGE